jgi:hypothetical protein
MFAQPGYWRAHQQSLIFTDCKQAFSSSSKSDELAKERCPGGGNGNQNNASVKGGTFHSDAQCQQGYGGRSCMSCVNKMEYTMAANGTCVLCPEGSSFVLAMVPMLSSCALLFLFVLVVSLRGISKTNATNSTSKMKRTSKMFGQLKILVSMLQIMSSMPSVLSGVQFSPFFRDMTNVFGIFNLDILSFSEVFSCSMSVSFFERFLIHMMLPIGCTLAILLALFVARTCTAKTDRAKRVRIQETVSKILIMVILLLFPGLSTKIFQVWKCTTVDGLEGEFLVQDYSITCNVGEHVTYILVAGSFLLVYIVGIPFTMFVLMWRNRKSLHDEKNPRHHAVKNVLGGLYIQCKYFFCADVVNCFCNLGQFF